MIKLYKWFEDILQEVGFDIVSQDNYTIVIQIHTASNRANRHKRTIHFVDLFNNISEHVGGGHYAFDANYKYKDVEKYMNLNRLYSKKKALELGIQIHKRELLHCEEQLLSVNSDIELWENK